jgi:peroxiredoxin Q/BCP
MLEINTKAPNFSLKDQNNKKHSLKDFQGQYVVLYFYPKDDTPGCTREACSMRDHFTILQKKAVILGVSSDSVASHKDFEEKYNLPFILLADTEKEVINAYQANGMSTKRITYLINPEGMIIKTYPKVNPSQHAQEIVDDLDAITK